MFADVVISTIAALAVFASVLALYAWWRLERLADQVYRLGWDIDAVLARLSKHEEQGH